MNKKRDYKREYKVTHSSSKAKKDRAARNKAHREAVKDGRIKKGEKNKEIDHKKPLRSGGSNNKSNTRVRSTSANRSDNGHKKGEKHKKRGK